MRQRKLDNTRGIFILWANWVIGTGAITLLIVLSLWVKPRYMALVALALDLIIFSLIKNNRKHRVPTCLLTPFLCSRVLLISAFIMAIINLMFSRWAINYFFDPETVNVQIPFIAQLIVAPTLLAVTLWAYFRKSKMSFCKDCYIRYGTPAERGFLGKITNQEGRYQLKMLLVVALIATLISYGYYFFAYINISFTKADKIVFVWAAVAFFLVITLYSAVRYLSLWGYYCKKEENIAKNSITMTRLRYLVFHDNYICIAPPRKDFNHLIDYEDKPDVPIQINLSYRVKISLLDAINNFKSFTHIHGADIRLMYETIGTNADNNIFHFLCFLNEQQKEQFDKENTDCKWVTLHELAEMINKGEISTLLSSEIIRLHTVTMAWKSYNPDGSRKYKIKHYKPTFRFCDLPTQNVDYNSPEWLYVDNNNEDMPLYHIKKFWRKYVNGIS